MKRLGLAVVLIGWLGLGSAQGDEGIAPDFWPQPQGVLDDMTALAQDPLQWDESSWMWAGVVGLGTVALHQRDSAIRTWVKGHDGSFQGGIARLGNNLGNGLLLVPAIGLGYVGGWMLKDETIMGDALAAAEAYVGSGVVAVAIKVTAGRARPFANEGGNRWRGPFQTDSTYESFPSGHATSAFAVASALATRHPGTWVGPVAYTLAASTLYGRIHADVHWASDVLFGAAIGYWAGTTVGKRNDPAQSFAWQVTPLPGGGQVQATWRW